MTTSTQDESLFTESTSERARKVAAAIAGDRYAKILKALLEKPQCCFEIAKEIGVFDHRISGRFTELRKLGMIERTGEERINPATDCNGNVWAIVGEHREAIEQSIVQKEEAGEPCDT